MPGSERGIDRAQYDKMHTQSLKDRDAFWTEAAKGIDWEVPHTKTVDDSRKPFYKWFAGGKLSVCHNLVDRHVATRGDQAALIYDSPVTNTQQKISYKELQSHVAKLAGVLVNLGVKLGDRVIIYMPMIPEAVYAMLACTRIGAVHSVVFGGFAAPELAARIDDAKPKLILASSCGVDGAKVVPYGPLMNKAIELAKSKPTGVVMKQRPQCPYEMVQGRDHDWDAVVKVAEAVPCVAVDSNHPLYILYTSGSTGKPKGVLRDCAPHLVALKWSMTNFMRTNPGEVYWAASDVGWVVGHSYSVYGPLVHGCTSIVYEGKPIGTPDAGAFWRVISQYKVSGFFTAPTALRGIRKEDPELELVKKYDLSSLRALFVAGERCDPTTAEVFNKKLNVDVVDNWWQTETGWPICGFQDAAIGMKSGSCSLPLPGYDVQVLDDQGNQVPAGTPGTIAVKLPLPPSCFPTLWNNDKGYVEGYLELYPGYYATGDAGMIDADGYVTVLERTDDVINVAAHRLSTGQIEAVVKAQPGVSDAAVIGALDATKGQVPVACVVVTCKPEETRALLDKIKLSVREQVGPIASLGGIVAVDQLPKTRSGKVLRKNIRGIADGKPVQVPATIDNPDALEIVTAALASIGFPKPASKL